LKLPSLAWLAFAGNPLCAAPPPLSGQEIPWQQLLIQQPLGEGASGIIQQALWQRPGLPANPVAIKLYKGSMTSDGSPLNEMAACIAAGEHRNLIDVQGRIPDHPQGQAGLVMQLIAPHFVNLAGPPSLDSCTRDIYPVDVRLPLAVALRMARGIASVSAHLHARGITHGDLYGHNILWKPEGDCLLGDFGAASFHPNPEQAKALERIEVRAFGILLGELLERCSEPAPLAWFELQARCIQPDVSQRPSMSEVERSLGAMHSL
jgi:serine/threonine protein kinase